MLREVAAESRRAEQEAAKDERAKERRRLKAAETRARNKAAAREAAAQEGAAASASAIVEAKATLCSARKRRTHGTTKARRGTEGLDAGRWTPRRSYTFMFSLTTAHAVAAAGTAQPLTMSSREIAELAGKLHADGMRDIRNEARPARPRSQQFCGHLLERPEQAAAAVQPPQGPDADPGVRLL
ncbi:MAG: Rha family transcriptional regulator [Comamonadaceae bacterium]|nr:Rha family transcriptional regulator [Comamonadaceae bacterium]